MGPVIVFIFGIVVLTIAATFAAVVLGIAAYLLTKKAAAHRARAIVAAIAFPYACVLFACIWFIACAIVNNAVFHRDMGFGDTWMTPLPDGYSILMIDTPDQAVVFDPKTQPAPDGVSSQSDTIQGVRQLQVAGPYLLGARDSDFSSHYGQDSTTVDVYFDFDTRSKTTSEFHTLADLQHEAARKGIPLHLRSIAQIYDQYAITWFDYFAGAVLMIVPLVGFAALVRYVWKIRRRGMITYVAKPV